jgi:hypothetical protein
MSSLASNVSPIYRLGDGFSWGNDEDPDNSSHSVFGEKALRISGDSDMGVFRDRSKSGISILAKEHPTLVIVGFMF